MKLLKFQADWCGPCKMMSSVIKNLGAKVTIPIEEINIDENMEETRKWKVTSVPTLILVDENGEIKRHMGTLREPQFLEFIKNDR